MFKKYLVLTLIVLVFNLASGGAVFAQQQDDKKAKKIQKVKTRVSRIGTGEKARVRVELLSQIKLKGYISAIDDDSFTVTDKKTGTATKVEYAQVKDLSRHHMSGTTKIIIAVAIAVPVTIFLLLFGSYYCNEHAC